MSLFSKIVKSATQPFRSVAKAVAKTAAGLFEDVTDPFLAPIDRILDAISPRFRFDANVNASLSGGTTHQILFPQIPGHQGLIGDLSGGLLSDLAINTDALRRIETELDFLQSAMRKGVYPHRDDTLYFGVSVTPAETFDTDVWLQIVGRDVDNAKTLIEMTVLLKKEVVKARFDAAKRQMPSGTPTPTYLEYADALELEESVQLPTSRSSNFNLRISVNAFDAAGKALAAPVAKLGEVGVWIERRNRGFAEVLHRFSCQQPKAWFSVVFPIDRREVISKGDDFKMPGIGEKGSLTGGAMRLSADCLVDAINELNLADSGAKPVSEAANPLGAALAARIARSDRARECLWNARQSLGRLQCADGVYDFRLRYKLRVENFSNATQRSIEELSYLTGTESGAKLRQFKITQSDLPPLSTYELTVYPLNNGDGESTAELQLNDKAAFCSISLVAGLGIAESTLLCKAVTSPSETARDAATLGWTVKDCAVPR